ncbi:MAG: general secretion pathway protein GspK [Fimbriimonadaceae bacterium]|nr:general secretion pathway protein GspK [Fimbriimonadaceae bacterium]
MRRTRRSGGVFVVSLAVIAGLVSVLALAAASQQAYAKTQLRRMEQRRARLVAQSGIQRALAVFQDQVLSPTTLNDDWAQLGQNGAEEFVLGDARFRIQVVDAAAKVNINTAPQAQLELLPLTPEQVDCLLDWREAGTNPRADGAKDEYYNGLEKPYNTKLGTLQSVDELLLIKGFTPLDLYTVRTDVVNTARPNRTTSGENDQLPLDELVTVDSTSQAVNSTGQTKLNIANASQIQIQQQAGVNQQVALAIFNQRASYTSVGQILATPGVPQQSYANILNNFTVGQAIQAGKMNLNTVSQAVLDTIPNLPPDVASAIITRQSSGFSGLGDLLDVPGMNNLTVLQQTAGLFEVNSQAFLIRVLGVSGATRIALQATVSVTNGAAKVVRIEEPPYADILTTWGWETEPTATTTLKEGP